MASAPALPVEKCELIACAMERTPISRPARSTYSNLPEAVQALAADRFPARRGADCEWFDTYFCWFIGCSFSYAACIILRHVLRTLASRVSTDYSDRQ